MLKAELHAHSSEDPHDTYIKHSARDLVDFLAARGYEVLALTLHERQYCPQSLSRYAEKRGILMIPGVEARIEGKDVLLYNFTERQVACISTFPELAREKHTHNLVIAPHPYYPAPYSLQERLRENISLFDAIEFCHLYNGLYNPNRPAEAIAREHGLPMVGTSDGHYRYQFGHTYTEIDAPKTIDGVIQAIKHGKVKISTRMLPLTDMSRLVFRVTMHRLFGER